MTALEHLNEINRRITILRETLERRFRLDYAVDRAVREIESELGRLKLQLKEK